ncbi:MAG: citramalate synthase [Clostridia bacterium]|nr:citramalate synthase [Clostridia bacterium]
MNKKILIYDNTIREASQRAGISLTPSDRIAIAEMLDGMGVDFIEGGLAGGSPRDDVFYREMQSRLLKHAKLVSFGSTVRPGTPVNDDPMLQALLDTGTEYVAVFGKASSFHAKEILGITEEENLKIISDTVSYLTARGRKVFFDAEQFFDGYVESPEYAVKCIRAAHEAGAFTIVLCDTNGGTLPFRVAEIMDEVLEACPEIAGKLGIHAHNDSGTADYATVEAVRHGASVCQVTLNGWGERCGNANLFTVVPVLQLKLGYDCIPDTQPLYNYAHACCETANIKMFEFAPFVGRNAFSHKAGVHADAVSKSSRSYEHVSPEKVGNSRNVMVSEQSGKAAVTVKLRKLLPGIELDKGKAAVITEKVKSLELLGYTFEGADASLEMLVRELLGIRRNWFRMSSYKVIVFGESDEKGIYESKTNEIIKSREALMPTAGAMVDVAVDSEQEITAANGIGPVDALDKALRKALSRFYPEIAKMHLVDYKVRVLESRLATASVVRVVIESSDGHDTWCTVGVSGDIIKASFDALCDSYDYMLENLSAGGD